MRLALFAFMVWLSAGAYAADSEGVPRIGVLLPETILKRWNVQLPKALSALGYVQGKNISYEWRPFRGSVAEARVLADDLVRSKVSLILALTTPSAKAVMAATETLPVVFVSGDPVAMGLAASLARPGKNGTGISMLGTELTAKRLDFLKQLLPRAKKVAYLRNPSNPLAAIMFEEARRATKILGLNLEEIDAQEPSAVEKALTTIRAKHVDGVLVSEDLIFASDEAVVQIASAMRNMRLPAVYPWSFYHSAGALMSYGVDLEEAYRRVAAYVDRVLKGAKPGDLPVEQISKYELIVDLKVAESLKLRVPQGILFRADKVLR
jgi:putative tryptophan/tyrosine transport system substrate-binding protein